MTDMSAASAFLSHPSFLVAAQARGESPAGFAGHTATLTMTFFILLGLLLVLIIWEVLAAAGRRREEKLFLPESTQRRRIEPIISEPAEQKECNDPFRSLLQDSARQSAAASSPGPEAAPPQIRREPAPSFSEAPTLAGGLGAQRPSFPGEPPAAFSPPPPQPAPQSFAPPAQPPPAPPAAQTPSSRKISLPGFQADQPPSAPPPARPEPSFADTSAAAPSPFPGAPKKTESWEDLLKVVSMEPGQDEPADSPKGAPAEAPPADDSVTLRWKSLLDKAREDVEGAPAAEQITHPRRPAGAPPAKEAVTPALSEPQRITTDAPRIPAPGRLARGEAPPAEPAAEPPGKPPQKGAKRILSLEIERKKEEPERQQQGDVPMFLKSAGKIIALPDKKSPQGPSKGDAQGPAPGQDPESPQEE